MKLIKLDLAVGQLSSYSMQCRLHWESIWLSQPRVCGWWKGTAHSVDPEFGRTMEWTVIGQQARVWPWFYLGLSKAKLNKPVLPRFLVVNTYIVVLIQNQHLKMLKPSDSEEVTRDNRGPGRLWSFIHAAIASIDLLTEQLIEMTRSFILHLTFLKGLAKLLLSYT